MDISPEYQKQLMGYLDSMVQTIKAGAQWTMEQLPDVARQWVMYNAWKSGVILFFCIIGLIVSVVAIWKLFAHIGSEDSWEGAEVLATFPFWVVGIAAVINGAQAINTLLLCAFAPKVFLIQTLMDLAGHATNSK